MVTEEFSFEQASNALASEKTRRFLSRQLVRAARGRRRNTRWRLWWFRLKLRRTWKIAFREYELAHALAYNLGADLNREVRPKAAAEGDLKFDVLTRLHARACSIGSEVYSLMAAGHASGAYARWRTLHEIAVVSCLIAPNDNELARRYLLHERLERAKAARLYLQHQERANLEPATEQEVSAVVEEADRLVKEFGEAFRSQYGWAAVLLNKDRPTFADLERAADLDHWRPYYQMASWGVHASPKGAVWNLSAGEMSDVLVAGAANAGLADPGHQALLSLLFSTSALVTVAPSVERIEGMKLLAKLVERAGRAFLETHESLGGSRTVYP